MGKGELKDRVLKIFGSIFGFIALFIKKVFSENNLRNRTNLLSFLLTVAFMFISLCFKNLSLFIILNIVLFLSKNIDKLTIIENSKYNNIISYLYIVLPSFCYVYLLGSGNADIILWLLLTVIILKITARIYDDVLDGVIINLGKFSSVGTLLVASVIGIISSILLKEKTILFVLVNITIALLMFLQEKISEKIARKFEDDDYNGYNKLLVMIYNDFVLVLPWIAFLISLQIIK